VITGVADAISQPKTDIRLFGKPSTRKYRRMGVVLTYGAVGDDVNALRAEARAAAAMVAVDGVPTPQ
jgi:phosphoribosylglycinamide formyltransferase 2